MQAENTDYLTSFAFRLNSRAEALGLSQADIAARLGVKPPRVNHWFQGNNYPRSRERSELVKVLQTTADWLYNGEGEPDRSAEVRDPAGDYGDEVRAVPLVSWAHAGAAATYEEIPKHSRTSVSSMSRDKRAFALTIEGDSMEPKFLPGDRVILEPSTLPRNGKAVVVKFADDAVQLRIYQKMPGGKIRLAPLNPVYAATEHEVKEFDWIYPVVELNRAV